jgi:hypothetical protein
MLNAAGLGAVASSSAASAADGVAVASLAWSADASWAAAARADGSLVVYATGTHYRALPALALQRFSVSMLASAVKLESLHTNTPGGVAASRALTHVFDK